VGGGASRVLPSSYQGWQQDVLDIDPAVHPDICCDAKDMASLARARYDAVYCSHNLEHFYRHDVPTVLQGFKHVLKPKGFAHIKVPDLGALMDAVVTGKKDLMDTWYISNGGPIRFHDVLYGWGAQMERGNLYYAHKCGFTVKSLAATLREAGFHSVYVSSEQWNIEALAFLTRPTLQQRKDLGLACR
jgi:ubiquinone/menaquinone biosynthesis C-methylase UbiE